jgi:TRAP transporter TAXI family solute receptor
MRIEATRPACAVLAALVGVIGCGGGKDGEVAKRHYVTIGTGGVTGVYYPAGGALAKLVNRKKDIYGLDVSVQATAGSVFNINAVLAGDMEFGIAQSDRQHQAYHGLAEWQPTGAREDLRAVCSLHPEIVTLVAADDAGIRTLSDLKGKRVNIGNPGSGQRGNALDVLRAAGIDEDIIAEGLKAAESAQMLQDGRIDAFFYTVGHPASAIMEAVAGQRRDVRIVPITGMDKLLAEAPYYSTATIPIKLYPKARNDADVPSIGVMTTIVTGANVPDDVVYALTKELFASLAEFRTMHPAFESLTAEGMLKGMSAPIHPGAMRYYTEAALK